MPRITLAVLVLCLAVLSLAVVAAPAPRRDAADELRSWGQPAFSARSARIDGNRLTVAGLKPFAARGSIRGLRDTTLIYCDPHDGLILWAAQFGADMKRATPFLGREQPGAKLLEMPCPETPLLEQLMRPVRLRLAVIDGGGRVRRKQTATVSTLRVEK
jgi:hypothetical protein